MNPYNPLELDLSERCTQMKLYLHGIMVQIAMTVIATQRTRQNTKNWVCSLMWSLLILQLMIYLFLECG